jgi:hypothetical protein
MKDVKPTIAIALLLSGLCRASFAQTCVFNIRAPDHDQDDHTARESVCGRAELKPLQDSYSEIIETRLLSLTSDMLPTIFGPKFPSPRKGWRPADPADLVLPLFGHGNMFDGDISHMNKMILHGAFNINGYDLYSVGNSGYIEFFEDGGGATAAAVIYLRADDKFIPLKSTNDFSKRLEWDKAKFNALIKWLDEHEPKATELGVVMVSASSPSRVDLGGGTVCILHTKELDNPGETIRSYRIDLTTEAQDGKDNGNTYATHKDFSRPGQSWGFFIDGKLYRMTPILVETLHEQVR